MDVSEVQLAKQDRSKDTTSLREFVEDDQAPAQTIRVCRVPTFAGPHASILDSL